MVIVVAVCVCVCVCVRGQKHIAKPKDMFTLLDGHRRNVFNHSTNTNPHSNNNTITNPHPHPPPWSPTPTLSPLPGDRSGC